MYYQHGDVLIFEAETVPSEAKRVSRGKSAVLRRGEATGHAHVAKAVQAGRMIDMFTLPNGVQFLVCHGEADVMHQQHKVGVLPKGTYQLRAVQEFDHFAEEARAVMD